MAEEQGSGAIATVPSPLRVPLGESGFAVFPFALGGAEFGWVANLSESHAVLDRYYEEGGNLVHTADHFGGGRSEHIIGRWVNARRVRDRMVLCVRVGLHPDNPGIDPVNLVRAVEGSLNRLATDRIDVLYLDGSARSQAGLEDILATAEWLVEAGKVRTIGAYALTPEQLVEARILASAGYPRIEVLDVPYNVMRRAEYEGDLRRVVAAQSLAFTPSHVLEHGFLSGRHRSKTGLQGARGSQVRASLNRRGVRVLRALDGISAELRVPVAAVAVAWLRAQRTVTAPIANVTEPGQLDELLQGMRIRLDRGHLAEASRAITGVRLG